MCSCSPRAASSPRARPRPWRPIRLSSRHTSARARRNLPRRGREMTLLAVESLHAGYGATEVLHGIDLAVAPGEIVAVLGSNGAGKSTLNRAISGLVRARAGAIRFDETLVTNHRPASIVARGLIHVPEGRRLFPHLSVAENLHLRR